MENNDRKKDRKLIVCLCVTALAGAAHICVNGAFKILILYTLCMAASIPTLFFNYSLCKLENKRRSTLYERYTGDGEPSEFRLKKGKIAEWFLFVVGLLISLFSVVYSF